MYIIDHKFKNQQFISKAHLKEVYMTSTLAEKTQLKAQLFTSIQQLGLQDQLKKQLRIQICEKLKQKDLIKKSTQQSHEAKLYNRIMASLISEQLKINDCGYSNSIFVAESGYDLKILDRSEVIEIMGMSQQDLNGKYSILGNLITRKYPFNGGTLRTTAIQTNPEDVGYTLEQRLALIDLEYRKNLANSSPNKQQVDYKRKLDEVEHDLKRAYERDIERFKQFEAHNIKIKVSQQWRKKFEEYSNSISNQYRIKVEHLRKKQRVLEDNIVNKTKVLDQKTVSTHKNFLQKVDLLQIKSSIATETQKNLQIERKRTKQQHKKLEEQLKAKIREHDSLLLQLNDKIAYEVGVAKLALQQQYQQKNAEFLSRKKFIDQQYGKIMGIKDTTDIIKQESKRLHEENLRLRKDLTEIQQQLRVSMSENSTKSDRLESLRAELNQLQRQKTLREQTLREQIKKCKNREQQVSELRQQLDQLRGWKQQHEANNLSKSIQSSIMNLDQQQNQDNELPRHPPSISQPQSEIAHKLQILKQERKKQIQRLRMQL